MLAVTGFLATSLYWPGVSGAATTPRWAALAILVPWLIKDRCHFTPAHWFGLALIGWAGVSLLWATSPLDGGGQLFFLVLLAGLFWLGSQQGNFRGFYIGCGLGLWVSSVFAIGQALGWHPVREWWVDGAPSGLYVNGNYMAEAAALILVAAISERILWLIPGLLPALLLPHPRGALLAVTAAMAVYLWRLNRLASATVCVVIAAAGAWSVAHLDHSSIERFTIWQSAWNGLTLFGHGIGSFWTAFPPFDLRVGAAALPDHAHNEFLNIAFEVGLPGLVLALAFCATLIGPLDTSRLVLIALFVEACFAFPFHLPATAAIGFVVAGYAVRTRFVLRDVVLRSGRNVPPWVATEPAFPRFPIEPRRRYTTISLGPSFPRRGCASHGGRTIEGRRWPNATT